MNQNDVIDVLTAVAAGDRRTVGPEDVQLWGMVLDADMPKTFALEAVLAHFKERPDTWLQPGHIQQRWRDYRRDQLAREEDAAREARQAALDARNVADLGADALAAGLSVEVPLKYFRRSQQPGGNPLTVPCPWCKATVGQHCHFPFSTERTKNPHPSRVEAVQPKEESA